MYQNDRVLILGIETSCDDTGVALYDSERRELVAHAVHTQAAMHEAYGGVVPGSPRATTSAGWCR